MKNSTIFARGTLGTREDSTFKLLVPLRPARTQYTAAAGAAGAAGADGACGGAAAAVLRVSKESSIVPAADDGPLPRRQLRSSSDPQLLDLGFSLSWCVLVLALVPCNG